MGNTQTDINVVADHSLIYEAAIDTTQKMARDQRSDEMGENLGGEFVSNIKGALQRIMIKAEDVDNMYEDKQTRVNRGSRLSEVCELVIPKGSKSARSGESGVSTNANSTSSFAQVSE